MMKAFRQRYLAIIGFVVLFLFGCQLRSQDDTVVDCRSQLVSSSLTLNVFSSQRNNPEASRFSWVPIEAGEDGVYSAPSRDVMFELNFEPKVSIGCTYHGGWLLLRSRSPIQEFNDQVYWYRKLGKYPFFLLDEDVPSGTWHFRACFGSYEPVGCSYYSDDIVVQIPSL